MASNLPPVKQILREQIKGAPDWISQLLFPLNRFMLSVYNDLDGGLTTENMVEQKQVITFTTPSSGFTPVTFSCTLPVVPSIVLLGQIRPTSGNTVFTTAVALSSWSYSSTSGSNGANQVSINYISGLSANTSYTATLLIR